MSRSGYVHLDDCEVMRTSENAVLVAYEGEQHWIPRSQMPPGDDREFAVGDTVTITISEWLATKKGIES